ncbi:flagellar motor switch protein FliN [Acidithiobacillus caldus]|jgi:flagellar motor switch protein FliN/FliY|uniref:Flagellar motor switch protein FliN n=4 Tax=Acidithiobacillus caldus TaxID=33059 RepID=F9ZN97_ACICS|nr:flagellar motor switch protein FliN [Acidithiobacillus caldus]AEK58140.1 Flagellar motor switch protein FliN [Acidithiobacillus caldus SM-1]AIA55128.1 Flagellar motor switch protein FliN [Acidithiobacillus caldus ATCC 51756]AUW32781.1 flagellar motor switch protein FliN [Acidithiobacillus caldus]MBU2730252.1 flagellar motor switch protein FliN [Acidithiobacillus caldus]MBU2734325.1 flagellar motor switch protein FliN [Acidithiobacillus caldus ATCC 51756]
MADDDNQDAGTMDDWAAAMAEQAAVTAAGKTDKDTPPSAEPVAAAPMPDLEETSPAGGAPAGGAHANLDMILDIPVNLSVELGRTKIQIRNLLQLAQGSVVELERLAGEPMDVLVNGYLIAQGEVVLVNDKFGIRLTDIISPAERARKLR